MIVDQRNKWCILTPPKTASTTLQIVFKEPKFSAAVVGAQHCMDPPEGVKRVLATVRDPWARTVSLWRHRCLESYQRLVRDTGEDPFPLRDETRHFLAQAAKEYPFMTFMDDVDDKRLNDFFSFSLCDWLQYVTPEIIHLERLNEELKAALPDLPWDQEKLPFHNRNVLVTSNHLLVDTETTNYLAVPDPLEDLEARRRVLAWCREDFERFGYSTDYPGTEAGDGSQ